LVNIGENVIIAGLVLQAIWFAFFIAVAGLFHFRMARVPTSKAQMDEIRWQSYLRTLYFVSILIMLRSIVRVIEYIQGNDGFILRNEVFLYVFDSLPMLSVMLWMSWKHPSEVGLLLRGERMQRNEPTTRNSIQLG
jgi:RTA1 like protein